MRRAGIAVVRAVVVRRAHGAARRRVPLVAARARAARQVVARHAVGVARAVRLYSARPRAVRIPVVAALALVTVLPRERVRAHAAVVAAELVLAVARAVRLEPRDRLRVAVAARRVRAGRRADRERAEAGQAAVAVGRRVDAGGAGLALFAAPLVAALAVARPRVTRHAQRVRRAVGDDVADARRAVGTRIAGEAGDAVGARVEELGTR